MIQCNAEMHKTRLQLAVQNPELYHYLIEDEKTQYEREKEIIQMMMIEPASLGSNGQHANEMLRIEK